MIKGLGYAFGLLIVIPLLIFIVNFIFFRGNQVTPEQVKQYIKNSNIIEIFIPAGLARNSKVYSPKLTSGNNTKIIYRHTFYSKEHQKYLMLISFSGFDFSDKFNTDKSDSRCRTINYGGYFVVRANQAQWNNPSYGTSENPMPIFGVEVIGTIMGKPEKIKTIWQTKEQFDIPDDINFLFVEQYLDHFLPKTEFNKLFD